MNFLQHDEQPKKTVAFQVDQEQKVEDTEVKLAQKESEIEDVTSKAVLKQIPQDEEISSSVTGKLKRRVTKKVCQNE